MKRAPVIDLSECSRVKVLYPLVTCRRYDPQVRSPMGFPCRKRQSKLTDSSSRGSERRNVEAMLETFVDWING